MARKKILYWLGAGASAQALPIVSEMPAAFHNHVAWVANMIGPQVEYETYLKQLARDIVPYGTVDTYARALFLQGNNTDRLDELKLHLSYYFMIEQLHEEKLQLDLKFEKRFAIDPRYMGWLALLFKDMWRLREDVNIVSWNYDLQVQHALTKYITSSKIQDVFINSNWSIYPDLRPTGRVEDKRPFLVHLNGMAGLVEEQGNQKFLAHDLTAQETSTVLNRWFSIYNNRGRHRRAIPEQMRDAFTFAWEDSGIAKDARHYAKQLMNRAEVLVVIGYSFPLFNREVDKELIDAFNQPLERLSRPEGEAHRKRVVIQNPSPGADEDFLQAFEWSRSVIYPSVTQVSGTSAFHVPSEMF